MHRSSADDFIIFYLKKFLNFFFLHFFKIKKNIYKVDENMLEVGYFFISKFKEGASALFRRVKNQIFY